MGLLDKETSHKGTKGSQNKNKGREKCIVLTRNEQ